MQVAQETQVQSLGWEDPWRRKWQPTPVFLPGEAHGQRRLAGYSPQGRKELDMTEQLGTCSRVRWKKDSFWSSNPRQKRPVQSSYLHGFLQLFRIKHCRWGHEAYHEMLEVAREITLQVIFQFLKLKERERENHEPLLFLQSHQMQINSHRSIFTISLYLLWMYMFFVWIHTFMFFYY